MGRAGGSAGKRPGGLVSDFPEGHQNLRCSRQPIPKKIFNPPAYSQKIF